MPLLHRSYDLINEAGFPSLWITPDPSFHGYLIGDAHIGKKALFVQDFLSQSSWLMKHRGVEIDIVSKAG
jgi:hypothetical protein